MTAGAEALQRSLRAGEAALRIDIADLIEGQGVARLVRHNCRRTVAL
jgi:hypothetical protein